MFDPRQSTPTVTDLIDVLREADQAHARAVGMLMAIGGAQIVRERAMPAEMALALGANRPRWEIHQIFAVAEQLAHLPITRAALARGQITYAQARAIALELRELDLEQRRGIDARVGELAAHLADAEPEALINQVTHLAALTRPDLRVRREDRKVESNYLAISPYLDGTGGTLAGQLDAASMTSLTTALDAEADDPVDPDDSDAPDRGRQRAEALVRIAEASLAGTDPHGSARTRPRARMIMTVEVTDLDEPHANGARVLWGLAGRPGRLSPIASEIEACDAHLQTVLMACGRPIAVSDVTSDVPAKVRAAVIARDGGCRGPDCAAPASWSQIHHINSKAGHHLSNLVLLCQRCHTRVHRRVWRIRVGDDDLVSFTHRGRTWTSAPRARPLRV